MGTLVEASVIVHAPFSREDSSNDLNMTSRSATTKDADRDSVIDMQPEEHVMVKQNGHAVPNGRVPLTIDTSLEEPKSELDTTPKSSPSDTDSGFEKCLNSPTSTGSPVSTKSDSPSAYSETESPETVVIVSHNPEEKSKEGAKNSSVAQTETKTENKNKVQTRDKSSNSGQPKGILKHRNIISEGFVNLTFDDCGEDHTGTQSRPNSLLAHEMALNMSSCDKLPGANGAISVADSQRISAKLQSPLDARARSRNQHKAYWVLLAVVVLLIIAAVIIVPILWVTQQDQNQNPAGGATNSTASP